MGYCYCTATVVYGASPAPKTCEDCLIAKPMVVGCGQGLEPCGSTTDIDLNATNKNPAGAVYTLRKFDTDAFSAATLTPQGVLSVTTDELYEDPHALYLVEYMVEKDGYKTFGEIRFCFDSPCDAGCSKCNTCSGECYGDGDSPTVLVNCGDVDEVVDISGALNLAACDGTNTFSLTVPDGVSAVIDGAGVITASIDNDVEPGKKYRVLWKLECSKYGMTAEGYVDFEVEDLCVGVTCGANQYCDGCTGDCEDLESDLGVSKDGITSTGGGGGTTFV